MDRVRGHRVAGPASAYDGARHYWSAAMQAAGMLINIGGQAWSAAEGPSGKIPVPIRRELGIQGQRQDEAWAEQQQAWRMQQLLAPFLLEQMGLEASIGPNGEITGLKKRPPTTSDQQAADIKDLANKKVLQGLRGELDIDPGATRSLNEQDARQKEMLARALGPDYALSTAGGTALNRQAESRNITEAALRTNETLAAEDIAQGRIANEFRTRQFQAGLEAGYPISMSQMAGRSFDMARGMQFPDTELALAQYRANQARRQVWPRFVQGVGTSMSEMGGGMMGGGGLSGGFAGMDRGGWRGQAYSPTVRSNSPVWTDQFGGP